MVRLALRNPYAVIVMALAILIFGVTALDRIPTDLLPIFVKDVAHTEDSYQIQTNIVRVNGRRQVYIPIYRQPGANTIQIVDGVKKAIGPILERLPKGINLDVLMDQSVYVRKAIADLVQEGVLGAAEIRPLALGYPVNYTLMPW